MSNYNNLKATIDANIKQNGKQEISGSILNSALNQMVTTLGAGYQYVGVATTKTNPGSPDAKVFYIANGKGVYDNFGGLEVTEDEVVVLYWDSSWHKVSTGIASQEKLTELKEKVDALALGIFYGYFPDSASLPTDVTTPGYAYVGLDNPYKIWNFNGDSWFDSGTSIDLNDADEEDITRNAEGKLQFKDRAYGDGMGYVILRKDKTFAEQVVKANTIYEIRYDFDLGGNNVEIPHNCVLRFNGGVVKNGILHGEAFIDGKIFNEGENYAQYNTDVLNTLCGLELHLSLNGENIYFKNESPIIIQKNFMMENCKIHFTGTVPLFSIGTTKIDFINFYNVIFEGISASGEISNLFLSDDSNDYKLNSLSFVGCKFNYCRIIKKDFSTISSSDMDTGIHNINVHKCIVTNCLHPFLSINNNVYELYEVSDSKFYNCRGAIISSANTINITQNTNKAKFVCHDNIVINDNTTFSSNSYNCFVLLKAFNVSIRNNYVEGIKSDVIGKPTYDYYASCDRLQFVNNTTINVGNIAENSSVEFAQDDSRFTNQVYKCKEVISSNILSERFIVGNRFVITKEFADSFLDGNRIGYFLYMAGYVDNVIIKDNIIDIYGNLVSSYNIDSSIFKFDSNNISILGVSSLSSNWITELAMSVLSFINLSIRPNKVVSNNTLESKVLRTYRPLFISNTIGLHNMYINTLAYPFSPSDSVPYICDNYGNINENSIL